MKDKKPNPELVLFQKRGIALLANKFVCDYRAFRTHGGDELERFYEIWAPSFVKNINMRSRVWRCALQQLKAA